MCQHVLLGKYNYLHLQLEKISFRNFVPIYQYTRRHILEGTVIHVVATQHIMVFRTIHSTTLSAA